MFVRWFEPAMDSILDREYSIIIIIWVGGAVVAAI